jgi:NhaP-type Na+/H+ or K+/H+ antiporter
LHDPHLLLYLAAVPLLGIAAQWLAWRSHVPSILLLLAFGIGLGYFVRPDQALAVLTGSDPSIAPRLLFPPVSLAVGIIMFEGGLTLRFHELKTGGRSLFRLVTLGALIAWVANTLAAWWLLQFDLRLACLLGAILIVTGPTVVGPLLHFIRPQRRVGSIAKWEGIVIDPIGAVLAVLVFEVLFTSSGPATLDSALTILLRTALIGGGFGVVTAWFLARCVQRFWIPDYLQGVGVLAVAGGVFALSNALEPESGLVTVTVLGIALANRKDISLRQVNELAEHLVVLLISCLFIVLGSRLELGVLADLHWRGLAFVAVLIVAARPLSVFVSLWGSALSWRERLFLACLAPRGIVAAAVSSVFGLSVAALLASEGAADQLIVQAQQLAPVTFLVILATVSCYGLAAAPVARALRLADTNPQGILFGGADPWVRDMATAVKSCGFPVMLVDTNVRNVSEARMAGLSAECASILSEHVQEELDLGGIGRLLAVTPNDEVNALAVRELAHVFGRAQVYQLAPRNVDSRRRQSVPARLRGRLAFDRTVNRDELGMRLAAGAKVKKTPLTEKFTWADYQATYGESAAVLFVVEPTKRLIVCSDETQPKAPPGSTLIALVSSHLDTAEPEEPPDAVEALGGTA